MDIVNEGSRKGSLPVRLAGYGFGEVGTTLLHQTERPGFHPQARRIYEDHLKEEEARPGCHPPVRLKVKDPTFASEQKMTVVWKNCLLEGEQNKAEVKRTSATNASKINSICQASSTRGQCIT